MIETGIEKSEAEGKIAKRFGQKTRGLKRAKEEAERHLSSLNLVRVLMISKVGNVGGTIARRRSKLTCNRWS